MSSILRSILFSALFWATAMFCFAIIRFMGIGDEIPIMLKLGYKGKMLLKQRMLGMSILGFGLGAIYGIVSLMYQRGLASKFSMGINLVFNTALHFIATIITMTILGSIIAQMFKVEVDLKPGWWIDDARFWGLVFFIVLCSVVQSFITMATQRFGRNMFVKTLIGYYADPKEEERILMFLDLKDSTTIAERLGHVQYSQFIQDCFTDLNSVVSAYDAEIYQYVGDEAVISWSYQRGLSKSNCVRLYFAFRDRLKSRGAYYQDRYGHQPVFKAGLHGGRLMVAEVGHVKKELAYHGDVINTAARIQAECNKHGTPLLLSEQLKSKLVQNAELEYKRIGEVQLKGKAEKTAIYSVAERAL